MIVWEAVEGAACSGALVSMVICLSKCSHLVMAFYLKLKFETEFVAAHQAM
jgi:hypothetical protein